MIMPRVLLLLCALPVLTVAARTVRAPLSLHERHDARRPLAYASVGQSGDFGTSRNTGEEDAQTWTVACGVGWLYGLGLCIGPFFGTGVGLTIPGGILAGAGGGVGIVFGIGMGGGVIWGGGRGVVKGFGVSPPMRPPFADGIPRPADIPTLGEIARLATDTADQLREQMTERWGSLRQGRR